MRADDSNRFGETLRRYRLAAGLSQAELADRAALSLRGVSDLERGKRRAPYPATVRRLAEALELADADRQVLVAASQRISTAPLAHGAVFRLPSPLTSFIGREEEITKLEQLVRRSRLVTLTGPGGVGKTRLAIETARRLATEYPEGIVFVDLSVVAAPEFVPVCVAAGIGVNQPRRGGVMDVLVGALRPRRLLLVLDNCEHVVQACAETVRTLLEECSQLRVLATSRQQLGVAGEVVWSVPALVAPETSPGSALDIGAVMQTAAARLFINRLQAARPEYAPTPADARAVAEICRRLEGIPLAIELAAARTTVLSVSEIAQQLDHPLRVLVSAQRTGPVRHRALGATLEWSYDLLDHSERRLFERLAVFVGGCTREAAEAVCVGPDLEEGAILDVLERLVRHSLVLADTTARPTRFRLLHTVRHYANECLIRGNDVDAVRDRHSAFFTSLAEQAASALVGPEEGAWLARLEREHDNIGSALRWLIDHDALGSAQRLAGSLYRFWFGRGHFTEGRAYLSQALDLSRGSEPSADRAACWLGMDLLALAQGDWEKARVAAEAARDDWRSVGLAGESALALRQLGILKLIGGEPGAALAEFQQGLEAARSVGHRIAEGLNLWGIAQVQAHQGAFVEAHHTADAALGCFAAVGWRRGAVNVLSFVGDLNYQKGQRTAARAILEQSLGIARELGAESLYCSTLVRLGQIAIESGDLTRASTLLEESLRLSAQVADRESLAAALSTCSLLASALADWRGALICASAASNLRPGPARGGPTSSARARPGAGQLLERQIAKARAVLESEQAAAAWAAGQALSWDSAAAEGLAICALADTANTGVAGARRPEASLTSRQLEVLRLVAEGKNNHEIADELVLSDKTVKRHLDNIFDKLGVSSRTAASALGLRAGII